MQKLITFFFCFFVMITSSFAQDQNNTPPKKIKLNLVFDWQNPNAPFNLEKIHLQKSIEIDPNQSTYHVVASETNASEKLPVTWALLLQPMDITKTQMGVQFIIVQYGMNRSGQIIAAPKIIFRNDQEAQMMLAASGVPMKIKVYAKWS